MEIRLPLVAVDADMNTFKSHLDAKFFHDYIKCLGSSDANPVKQEAHILKSGP